MNEEDPRKVPEPDSALASETGVSESLRHGLSLAKIQVELEELESVLASQKADYKMEVARLHMRRAHLVKTIVSGQRGLF